MCHKFCELLKEVIHNDGTCISFIMLNIFLVSGSMKGKGKGMSESKDCPLQFPDLKPVDHIKACPLFASGKSLKFIRYWW